MAFAQVGFFSNVLGMHTSMNVLLPQSAAGGRAEGYPVLYLLHGLSDDHSNWTRLTSIERYVRERELVVVMPCGHRSFYTNMKSGARYWDFLADELPQVAGDFFRISNRPSDTYACGLSMGGYGALKLGLRRPDSFNAVCGISPVTRIFDMGWHGEPGWQHEYAGIFGSPAEAKGSNDDLFALAERFNAANASTRIMHICGTEDFLHEDNLALRDHFRALGIKSEYIEEPGAHTWEFWDRHVQTALEFFGL